MEPNIETHRARKERLKERRQEKLAKAAQRRELFEAEIRSNYTQRRAIQEMLTCPATTSAQPSSGYTGLSGSLLHAHPPAGWVTTSEPALPVICEEVQKRSRSHCSEPAEEEAQGQSWSGVSISDSALPSISEEHRRRSFTGGSTISETARQLVAAEVQRRSWTGGGEISESAFPIAAEEVQKRSWTSGPS